MKLQLLHINKFIYIILLCFFVINLNGCTNKEIKSTKDVSSINHIKKKNYNKLNLSTKKIVIDLCSSKIKSRYIEDEGNKKAVKYVENIFKDLNLEYVFQKSYLHKFKYKIEDYSKDNKLIIKQIVLNNIVGKLRGENNKQAIVLTAHIDSFGKGTLDNASGVATILKIAEILKKDSIKNPFNCDIIFCITNAEMQLFKGSTAFLKDIRKYYTKLYNVNIDCVGLKMGKALALKNISRVKESAILYDSLKKVLNEHNIKFTNTISTLKAENASKKHFGVSDYFTFEKEGIPNIHIAQSGIEPLPEKENASTEILDFNELDKISKTLAEWLKDF